MKSVESLSAEPIFYAGKLEFKLFSIPANYAAFLWLAFFPSLNGIGKGGRYEVGG